LIHKLGKEEGAHLLIPEDDLIAVQNEAKVTIDDIASKINNFEDRKRQKIQYMKEE
jgi:hypothetical protein